MSNASAPTVRRVRIVLWSLVLVAALGATALFFLRGPQAPLAVTGEAFTLASTGGTEFTEQDLKGRPSLVFFGYTYCPDVCPTTLAESAAWRRELGLSSEQLRILFVTVDPERDTLPTMTEYLGGIDPSIIGLVGDSEQTEAAKRAFGASSEKAAGDTGDDYLVNHTASVFLLDAQGRFRGTIAYGEARSTALAKIERLVGA